jgi:hypothetical protein
MHLPNLVYLRLSLCTSNLWRHLLVRINYYCCCITSIFMWVDLFVFLFVFMKSTVMLFLIKWVNVRIICYAASSSGARLTHRRVQDYKYKLLL